MRSASPSGRPADSARRRGPERDSGSQSAGPAGTRRGRQALGRRRSDVASAARRALRSVAGGRLAELPVTLRFWEGSELAAAHPAGPALVILVRGPAAVAHLLHQPGQLGLARAWLTGALELEGDLDALLGIRERFGDLSVSASERARLAWAAGRIAGPRVLRRPPVPSIEASVSGRRHSLRRDGNAVRHHYDVSNRFYRFVLGPSMVYSCAYFHAPEDSLEEAQARKLDLICQKLGIAPGERLLDIGCGWGSLLAHAANYGVRAVGVRLSEPQAELARARLREAGLGHRVEIRVADYRQITDGPFDKIASVGMYEHVGRSELDQYVQTVKSLLVPGGLFLNHGIARWPRTRPDLTRSSPATCSPTGSSIP